MDVVGERLLSLSISTEHLAPVGISRPPNAFPPSQICLRKSSTFLIAFYKASAGPRYAHSCSIWPCRHLRPRKCPSAPPSSSPRPAVPLVELALRSRTDDPAERHSRSTCRAVNIEKGLLFLLKLFNLSIFTISSLRAISLPSVCLDFEDSLIVQNELPISSARTQNPRTQWFRNSKSPSLAWDVWVLDMLFTSWERLHEQIWLLLVIRVQNAASGLRRTS
jgi:hypothetical protein